MSETVCFHSGFQSMFRCVRVTGNELMINVRVTCGSLIGHWGWRSFVNDAPADMNYRRSGIVENEIT